MSQVTTKFRRNASPTSPSWMIRWNMTSGSRIVQRGAARRVDAAFEAREAAEIRVPGLVDSLDPPHAVAVEVDADLGREPLVEDQAIAAHVDLDQDRPAARESSGHEHVD